MINLGEISFFLVKNSTDENGQLIAYASFVINNEFLVGGVKIIRDTMQPLGYRLGYPSKKSSAGNSRICFRPIGFEASSTLPEIIIKEFILQRTKLAEKAADFKKWLAALP